MLHLGLRARDLTNKKPQLAVKPDGVVLVGASY